MHDDRNTHLPAATSDQRGLTLDPTLAALALADASAAEQFAAFREMNGGPTWPTSMVALLKPFSVEEFAALGEILDPAADRRVLVGWLSLLAHGDLTDLPPGYPSVAALFTHDDAGVRTAALRVAQSAHDNVLSNGLRLNGCPKQMNEPELQ